MQALSLSSSSSYSLKATIKAAVNKCAVIYYKHSDVISQFSLITLNTTVLASKIFQQIPRIFERASNVLLNFMGIIWLNMQIRDLIKRGEDCLLAIKARDWEGLAFCAAKVTVKALGILLCCGSLLAALVALSGYPAVALSMYLLMRPYSLFSFALGIAVDVADYEFSRLLALKMKKLNNKNNSESKIQSFMKDFRRLLIDKQGAGVDRLVFHVFRQQEHYTLENLRNKFEKSLSNEEIKQMFLSLKKALKNKQVLTQANFGLIALGYVCMGICRLYPETLIQSLTLWGISMLYTGKLLYQKYLNKKERL